MRVSTVEVNALRDPRRPFPTDLRPIRSALNGLELRDMSSDDLEEMERVLSAALIAVRRTWEGMDDVHRRREWDDVGPSAPRSTGIHGYLASPLFDHLRREYQRGRKTYVSEPYSIGPAGLIDACGLMNEGWCIEVRPRFATHFPGRTMAVRFWRDEDA